MTGHLGDTYDSLRKAKQLVAIVQASEPDAASCSQLLAANQSRLERAKLHLLDAIQSLTEALEKK